MKQKIQFLLHTAGVFSYYYGYQYFIRSVELAVQNPERLQSIQKEIYIIVASEFQTSIASVERDIRTIRDVMMKNGGMSCMNVNSASMNVAMKSMNT